MHAHPALAGLPRRNWLTKDTDDSIADDVFKGLTAVRRYIPSKYFYDARGSQLFETICRLPEYYPTRTELQILLDHAEDMTKAFRRGNLVELGSGSHRKIRILLDALGRQRRSGVTYMPVDVSEAALTQSAEELKAVYPELEIRCVVADFTRDLHRIPSNRPKLVLFFGSTIGNLDELERRSFLRGVARVLNAGDRFLLGLDMLKATHILEAAYNDSRNVTAEFNKNILLVLNRELQADFRTDDFDHLAFFNEKLDRVEMHLQAKRMIQVEVRRIELSFTLEQGETIRTEICRKFSRARAERMINDAGLEVRRWYSDANNWFSIAEIVLQQWSNSSLKF
jgi:L-histidine N-alpha-methyltransferase